YRSNGQLVADRQAAGALAGGSEDRGAQGRRKRRQPPTADTPRRHIDAVGDDPDVRDRRRLVDTNDPEAVEIVLLDATVLEADLAIFGEAQPHHRRPLDLRVDPLWVGCKAAIDRSVDARYGQISLVVHRDLD